MNSTNRFKSGLSFGVAMTVILIMQNYLKSDNHTSGEIMKLMVSGVIGGSVSGFLFGWITGLFSKSGFVNETTKIDVEADEAILFETPANHFKGLEAVGGKLYLTNKRLIFKSHKLNIQNHQLSIYLTDVNTLGTYKTLGIVNNGLSVTSSRGNVEKFVVEQRDEWIKLLTK